MMAQARQARDAAARLQNDPAFREQMHRTEQAAVRGMIADNPEIFMDLTRQCLTEYTAVPPPEELFDHNAATAVLQYATMHIWDTPTMREVRNGLFTTIAGYLPPIPIERSKVPLLAIRLIFDQVIAQKLGDAGWWLSDDVDPSRPTYVSGLEDNLPADRARNLIGTAHFIDFIRALLHHSRRRSTEPPGQLITALRRPARGPDTRWTTSLLSRTAGLVRA